jgi:hypothetical protein
VLVEQAQHFQAAARIQVDRRIQAQFGRRQRSGLRVEAVELGRVDGHRPGTSSRRRVVENPVCTKLSQLQSYWFIFFI